MDSQKSFSDFKEDFYGRVKDFTLFDCAEFNALKIVLDGLKVDYTSRGKVKSPLFGSLAAYRFENFLKLLKLKLSGAQVASDKEIKAFQFAPYAISDESRFGLDSQGKPHSYYFAELIETIGKHQCLHVIDKNRHPLLKADLVYERLSNKFLFLPFNNHEHELITAIRSTYNKIKKSSIFNQKELENIAFAFQNFFSQYRVWSRMLENVNPKALFCIAHYHNEGKLLAFKRKGIKIIELQHGLISTKDIFYVFPAQIRNVAERCLFADEIWVFGNYWKQVLEQGHEYVSKIKVAGYYLFDKFEGYPHAEQVIDDFAKGKKMILITTQTSLHEAFIKYIQWLNNDIGVRNLTYRILVKNHPLEKKEHYQQLTGLEHVLMVDYPLPIIFKKVCLHVSIYSTTLYDGARAGIPGFSLYTEPQKDYIEEILKSGVATALMPNQNPVDLLNQTKPVNAEHYYSRILIKDLLTKVIDTNN
jgi:hypothetical protein